MMRHSARIFCVILLLAAHVAFGQQTPFRVVGYYALNVAAKGHKKVPFKRLTHINLWFHNPDSLGNFKDYSSIVPFVKKAHRKNVKVLLSIGGGSRHTQYHRLLQDDNRPLLIENIMNEVSRYGVDGIDVDLEGKDIDTNYQVFVTELAARLHAQQKLITSAIAVYYTDQLTDSALAQYDFVNIMSYDRTGPWRPHEPGPHATYRHAEEDLDHFGVTRSLPPGKMTLGLPFYGYGFGPESTSPAISMTYGNIVSTFKGAEETDMLVMPDGKTLYYNGITTIKQKTKLARDKASGVMIWHIRGDARGSKSLLKAIHKMRKQYR